jgi:hypothetical protein
LRLLAGKMVELAIVDGISHVSPAAKKNELKPHTKVCWCVPPSQSGEFVAAMEDVLKLYEEPYDPARPVICMDETNKQLVGETHTPIPASPGQPRRIDYEYERRGTADVFLGNWRCVDITESRMTKTELSH